MDIKELNEKRLLKKMSYEDIAEFTGIKQEDVKAILLEQTKEYSYEGLLAMGTGYFIRRSNAVCL